MPAQKQSKEVKQRKEAFTNTVDGTEVNRVYTPGDLEKTKMEELPPPGE